MVTKVSIKFPLIRSNDAAGLILPPRSAPVDL